MRVPGVEPGSMASEATTLSIVIHSRRTRCQHSSGSGLFKLVLANIPASFAEASAVAKAMADKSEADTLSIVLHSQVTERVAFPGGAGFQAVCGVAQCATVTVAVSG